jgi:hypothetical protein
VRYARARSSDATYPRKFSRLFKAAEKGRLTTLRSLLGGTMLTRGTDIEARDFVRVAMGASACAGEARADRDGGARAARTHGADGVLRLQPRQVRQVPAGDRRISLLTRQRANGLRARGMRLNHERRAVGQVGGTALIHAAVRGNSDSVRALLNRQVEVELQDEVSVGRAGPNCG